MKHFIADLVRSPYFFKYLIPESELDNVIGIYIAGSAGINIDLTDDYSDYDIIVLTVEPMPERNFFEEYVRLKYKGRPAHWYYRPLEELLSLVDITDLNALCKVQFDFFFRRTTIYENPAHVNLIQQLDNLRTKISALASYAYLEAHLPQINKLVKQNCILKEDYSKLIYHWCVAGCYLTNTPLEIEYLKSIKRICWDPVPESYKDWAIDVLKKSVEFISANSWDCKEEFNKIYESLHK